MKKFRTKKMLVRQLREINVELRLISRWLAHSDIACEVVDRMCNFASDDWESIPIEDISRFRTRIGLDPERKPSDKRRKI